MDMTAKAVSGNISFPSDVNSNAISNGNNENTNKNDNSGNRQVSDGDTHNFKDNTNTNTNNTGTNSNPNTNINDTDADQPVAKLKKKSSLIFDETDVSMEENRFRDPKNEKRGESKQKRNYKLLHKSKSDIFLFFFILLFFYVEIYAQIALTNFVLQITPCKFI
ncbi:hypothetical protein RFI_05706 [Reticulomyxa filosa]|uniref:Uncharacterized protein n=1 Tax=Reticulomyxa filosa TaxID=46433 RepID=X6P1J5_RETFI|nr:hypothetical protein RFI_05706 [Reticulomyxa filosa]|eukprot:ETO31417.1 hypothetical protein RFI_05706 [Reticulomyxa filosa]